MMMQIERNTDNASRMIQIGRSFGLSDKEINELSASVYADYLRRNHPSGTHHMILCKLMVRRCVFVISARICAESPNSIFSKKQYFGYRNHLDSFSEIPFTCLTVYLLSYVVCFNETEVAEILNISSGQVRERLARALNLLGKRNQASLYYLF